MKCKKCGAEGILVNDQTLRGYRIYLCPNWDKGTCDYGAFLERTKKIVRN